MKNQSWKDGSPSGGGGGRLPPESDNLRSMPGSKLFSELRVSIITWWSTRNNNKKISKSRFVGFLFLSNFKMEGTFPGFSKGSKVAAHCH